MLTIYDELALFQLEDQWLLRDVLANLHFFKDRFVDEFKLNVTDVVISVDRISHWRLGQYRRGPNGLGLKGEITLSDRHVRDNHAPDRWWRVLGTLLHELLHAWQEAHGSPGRGNYHNTEFRNKSRRLGLLIATNGVTDYKPHSPFFAVIEKYGIHVPQLEQPVPPERKPSSAKLKLWTCGCPVRVRVAVSNFQDRCLVCGETFVLGSSIVETEQVGSVQIDDRWSIQMQEKV